MTCSKILEQLGEVEDYIKYEHIFETTEKQKKVVQIYIKVLNFREELLLEKDYQEIADQGLRVDPVLT